MAGQCEHEFCYCEEDTFEGYCSQACRDQQASHNAYYRCDCGHPECREATPLADEDQTRGDISSWQTSSKS
jgi:hypothetical protein